MSELINAIFHLPHRNASAVIAQSDVLEKSTPGSGSLTIIEQSVVAVVLCELLGSRLQRSTWLCIPLDKEYQRWVGESARTQRKLHRDGVRRESHAAVDGVPRCGHLRIEHLRLARHRPVPREAGELEYVQSAAAGATAGTGAV